MPYKNTDQQKKAQHNHYIKNKEKYKDYNNQRRQETQQWYETYKKNLCCTKCPENHPDCLDFHHDVERRNGKKEYTISYMARKGLSKETILKEISKCIILCANCHRKLHSKEREQNEG